MCKRTSFLVLSVLLFNPLSLQAQGLSVAGRDRSAVNVQPAGATSSAGSPLESGRLFSPSISRKFHDMAYDLAGPKDVKGPRVEQAIVFLTAAMELDSDSREVRPLLIDCACREPDQDYSNLVYGLLTDYVDEFADLDLARRAVEYLLTRMESAEQRQVLLERLLGALGGKNPVLASGLGTMLGLMAVQKADLEAAQFYLTQAYNNNKYNALAFVKLAELMPQQIAPAVYLERLRLALRENPANIDAAIVFAQYAEQLQLYEAAAAAYKYSADLFGYLYPSQALPARIYLPWAISSYNTRQSQAVCLQIADRVRREGGFDLRLEAIAAKAAIKIHDGELATRLFQTAEARAEQMLTQRTTIATENLGGSYSRQAYVEQFAWFYCFALPVPAKAVEWANTAFAAEPNSPVASALLAYALAMDRQIEWARPLLRNQQRSQIADLALALVQLADKQNDLATETLKSVIAKDPGSFAAETAKQILAQQGAEYVPPVDSAAVLASLQKTFGQSLVPVFTPFERMLSVQLDMRGDTFPYGTEFSGMVAITNNSSEPIVLSDDALFKGNVRIDAEIRGDLTASVPNLAIKKIRTAFVIEPGRSILTPIRLFTGRLRQMLLTYPQASLNIEFTLYLDPVITEGGNVTNRLTYVKPAGVQVRRPGIELTGKRLRDQFYSISKDHLGRKIETAQLFAALLAEQEAMSNREPLYRFMYADWVRPLLRDAFLHEAGLLRNRAEEEWVVKVHAMAEMLELPLDFELISAVAENLNNTKWPVRLMAMCLLAKSQGSRFGKVLDSTARNDPNRHVRDMAAVLGRSVSSATGVVANGPGRP